MSPVASDKYLSIYKTAMDSAVYLEQIAMKETVPGTVSFSRALDHTFLACLSHHTVQFETQSPAHMRGYLRDRR